MGLIAQVQRLHYVWSWRARYWWLDTRSGAQAHVIAFVLACLLLVGQMVRMAVAAVLVPPQHVEPAQAVYWWVVQLIILIVAAAVAYAMRPKPQHAKPQDVDAPVVQDGTAVKDYFGTCWIEHEDKFQLAWKVVGRDPIRSKGGK